MVQRPKEIMEISEKEEKLSEKLSEKPENKQKTNYAGMALERKVQRSNSQKEIKFEMVLKRGSSIEELEKNKGKETNDLFKISVGQKEINAGFEKILNDFYEQQYENHFVNDFNKFYHV